MWSTPRDGYPGNPKNSKYKSKEDKDDVPVGRVTATFRNDGNDPALANAKLYFQNGSELSFWGDLGHGSTPLNVYTYTGHVWKLMVDGEDKRTWTIESEHPSTQDYVI